MKVKMFGFVMFPVEPIVHDFVLPEIGNGNDLCESLRGQDAHKKKHKDQFYGMFHGELLIPT
jgi:hypothetical protein